MDKRGFAPIVLIVVVVVAVLTAGGIFFLASRKTQAPAQEPLQQGAPANMPINTTPTTATPPPAAPNSNASPILTQCTPFNSTTTVGASVFEVKNDALFINGAQKVANIPASLGLVASNVILPTGGYCSDLYYNPLPRNAFTVDQYAEPKSSTSGDKFAVIYFQQSYTPGDQNLRETVAKLLIYDLNGKLISATDLKELSDAERGNKNIEIYSGVYNNALSIIYFDDAAMYFDKDVGIDIDEDVFQSVDMSSGMVSDIGISAKLGYSGLISPDGRYLIYDDGSDNSVGLQAPACGLGSFPESDLKLFDFHVGTSTLLISDAHKGFVPVSWSKDGSSVLVLIQINNNAACTKNVDFLTYNLATKQISQDPNPGNVKGILTSVCTQDGFNCKDIDSWFPTGSQK